MSQDRAASSVPSGRNAPARTATGINAVPLPSNTAGGAIPQDPQAQAELAESIREELVPEPTFQRQRTGDHVWSATSTGPVSHDDQFALTSAETPTQEMKDLHYGALAVAVMAREFESSASREVGWDMDKPWVQEHSAPVYEKTANGMILGIPTEAPPTDSPFSISSTDLDFKWVTYPGPREDVDLRLPVALAHNDIDWGFGNFGVFEDAAPVSALAQTGLWGLPTDLVTFSPPERLYQARLFLSNLLAVGN